MKKKNNWNERIVFVTYSPRHTNGEIIRERERGLKDRNIFAYVHTNEKIYRNVFIVVSAIKNDCCCYCLPATVALADN